MAQHGGASFGETVRQVLDAYESGIADEAEALLSALLEGAIQSSQEAIAALELARQEVPLTRRELEARRQGHR